MQQWLACLLVAVLFAPWGQALPQHVHAGADHEHPEHAHGPAVHGHAPHARHARHTATAPDGVAHVEACAAADHVLPSVTASTVSVQAYGFTAALVASTWSPLSPGVTCLAIALMDVRGHGPPSRAQSSPRGPPLNTPA